jgi:hypothetical protein
VLTELNARPVGPLGTATTSGTTVSPPVAGFTEYNVVKFLRWSETQNGLVTLRETPQGFCRLASTAAAPAAARFETRYVRRQNCARTAETPIKAMTTQPVKENLPDFSVIERFLPSSANAFKIFSARVSFRRAVLVKSPFVQNRLTKTYACVLCAGLKIEPTDPQGLGGGGCQPITVEPPIQSKVRWRVSADRNRAIQRLGVCRSRLARPRSSPGRKSRFKNPDGPAVEPAGRV